MMGGKPWTKEEDQILRGFWYEVGFIADHMHLLPGRSKQSIEKRGAKLGLGPRKLWSAEQDELIRQIWLNGEPIKRHADKFPGHSLQSINTRANTLGLGRRPKRGSAEESVSWRLIEQELKRGDATRVQIAKKTRMHSSTAHKYLTIKHDAKQIHIVDWSRKHPSAKPLPVYRLGPGEDALHPGRLTNTAKERKYRREDIQRRVQAGETVRGINPFATAMGLAVVPKCEPGRIFKQSMDIDEWQQSPRKQAA